MRFVVEWWRSTAVRGQPETYFTGSWQHDSVVVGEEAAEKAIRAIRKTRRVNARATSSTGAIVMHISRESFYRLEKES